MNGLTLEAANATAQKPAAPTQSARKKTKAITVAISVATGGSVGSVKRPGRSGSRLIRDSDGSIKLRGKERTKTKLDNARVVMTCAPKATKTYTPDLVKSISPHDRAHQVTDSQSKLIPAARTRRRGGKVQTRVLVEDAKPREYPAYYMCNVHEEPGEHGPVRVGNSYEDQCDDLHERRLRLEGVPGLGYGTGESAAEQAQEYLSRLSPDECRKQFRRKP